MISVIISNYNYEKYISEALSSVFAQTFQDFEVIVVDDGSTDNSVEVIKEYMDIYPEKITLIEQKNSGQFEAFNKGFEHSRGDIIAFLDADDFWYSNKLEVINELHKIYSGVQHNLLINGQRKMTELDDKVQKQKYVWETYGFSGVIPTSGLSFTRKSLEWIFPLKGFGFKVCADWYLKSMYLNEFNIYSVDEAYGCYRAHGDNAWYYQQNKYNELGDYILKETNIYREKNFKKCVPKLTSELYMECLINSWGINQYESYILFGTGGLCEYFLSKYQYRILALTDSSNVELSEKFKLPYLPLKYIQENIIFDKVIIASDRIIEISDFLVENGIDKKQIITAKF